MGHFSQTLAAIPNVSSTTQAMAHLTALASTNTTLSSHGWSMVCPNHAPCYSIEDIVTAEADIRTIDYIFPMTQTGPIGTPPTCIINIFTKNPQVSHSYFVTAVLFTCSGSTDESRIVFEGTASIEAAAGDGLIVTGHCLMVQNTGSGIFEGVEGARAIFKNFWNHEITQTPPPGSELAAPNLRLRPVQWSFLLRDDVTYAMHLALSRGMT